MQISNLHNAGITLKFQCRDVHYSKQSHHHSKSSNYVKSLCLNMIWTGNGFLINILPINILTDGLQLRPNPSWLLFCSISFFKINDGDYYPAEFWGVGLVDELALGIGTIAKNVDDLLFASAKTFHGGAKALRIRHRVKVRRCNYRRYFLFVFTIDQMLTPNNTPFTH